MKESDIMGVLVEAEAKTETRKKAARLRFPNSCPEDTSTSSRSAVQFR